VMFKKLLRRICIIFARHISPKKQNAANNKLKSLCFNYLSEIVRFPLSLGIAYAFNLADGKGCHLDREKEKEK
jgi:hypothetical protein